MTNPEDKKEEAAEPPGERDLDKEIENMKALLAQAHQLEATVNRIVEKTLNDKSRK